MPAEEGVAPPTSPAADGSSGKESRRDRSSRRREGLGCCVWSEAASWPFGDCAPLLEARVRAWASHLLRERASSHDLQGLFEFSHHPPLGFLGKVRCLGPGMTPVHPGIGSVGRCALENDRASSALPAGVLFILQCPLGTGGLPRDGQHLCVLGGEGGSGAHCT